MLCWILYGNPLHALTCLVYVMKKTKKKQSKGISSQGRKTTSKKTPSLPASRKRIEQLLGAVRVVTQQKPSKALSSSSVSKKSTKELSSELKLTTSRPKRCVLMDTNFVMLPAAFKIDIFEQAKNALNTNSLEFAVFDKTIFELQHLASNHSKHAMHAQVALDLINRCNVTIIPGDNRYADDLIADFGTFIPDREVIIATQDKELKQRLTKTLRPRMLVMRGKNRLEVV